MKVFILLLALTVTISAAQASNDKVCKTFSGKYELIVVPSRAYVLENLSVPVIFIEKDMSNNLARHSFKINETDNDGYTLVASVHRLTAKVLVKKSDGSEIKFTGFCF